jgi:hypothetical protein
MMPMEKLERVLQGSSSAAPLFILNSYTSLHTYRKQSSGSAFIHPISREQFSDNAVQYVDDTLQFFNALGLSDLDTTLNHAQLYSNLHQVASLNSGIWSDCIWVLGGNLNSSICHNYVFHPKINLKKYYHIF